MIRNSDATRTALACGLFAFALTVEACGGSTGPSIPGTSTTSPAPPASPTAPPASPTGKPTTAPTQQPTMKPTPTSPPTATPKPTATPTSQPQACQVAPAPVPGTYTSIVIGGNLSGETVTLVSASSAWLRYAYTPAKPTPTPTVSPTTGPTPPPTPLFIYSGTYTVTTSGKTEPTGCAFLVTTQNGANLPQGAFNTAISGSPNLNGPATPALVATGSVTTLSLTNLTSTGGSGSFALNDGSTGTLSFTSRVAVNGAVPALLHQ